MKQVVRNGCSNCLGAKTSTRLLWIIPIHMSLKFSHHRLVQITLLYRFDMSVVWFEKLYIHLWCNKKISSYRCITPGWVKCSSCVPSTWLTDEFYEHKIHILNALDLIRTNPSRNIDKSQNSLCEHDISDILTVKSGWKIPMWAIQLRIMIFLLILM